MAKVSIPEKIKKAFEDYGHQCTLDKAVDIRFAPERSWAGILFKDDGELFAVDFQQNINGDWEVSNDYIRPFDSVKEFKETKLVDSWF